MRSCQVFICLSMRVGSGLSFPETLPSGHSFVAGCHVHDAALTLLRDSPSSTERTSPRPVRTEKEL